MAMMSNRRLITFSDEIVDGQPIYVSSNSLPIKALKLEPAGHSFHSAALRLFGCVEEKDAKDEKQEASSGKDQDTAHTFDSYSNKGKKKSGSGEQQQDHYALLGLSHLRYLATEDQIRKAYREVALKHHPDKQASLLLAEKTESAKQAKKDEIESHFKAIQEGYEVLMDPVRRRIYDSTDEFDDEIPTDCAPHEFYKVFGPAFMRNGRWSVTQPIPSFGDDSTPIQQVDQFYNFWYSFKSWREFPHADEFDLEQAESRDHKRWMERQNAKLSEKARKEEAVRIRSLVDSAYKRDPRILRRKDEEKAEKLRKKEAKNMAKKLQEEEAVKAAEEEKRKKEEEDKRAAETALQQKKLKEKEKKLVRKERSRLRNLSTTVVSKRLLGITDDDIEGICMTFSLEQLRNLCDRMEGKEELERAKLTKAAIGGAEDSKEEKTEKKEPPQNGSAVASNPVVSYTNVKKDKSWSKEEIELLKKGVLKYPKGTSRRWEVISEFIGSGRSVEEILKATKTVLLQKPDSNKAFDSFLEKRKTTATIASPLSTREEAGVSNGHIPEKKDTKPDNLPESSRQKTNCQTSEESASVNDVSGTDQDSWSVRVQLALNLPEGSQSAMGASCNCCPRENCESM
ncbi:hypothetical protein Leryth_002092 [Lithospermum erythrorhizon]|nr:hypothetical protein Leryth_002092 [Lithospermum erythrorhizon]